MLKISTETTGIGHLLEALELLAALLNLITDVVRYALHCRQGGSATDLPPQVTRLQRNGHLQNHVNIIEHLPKRQEDVCSLAEQVKSDFTVF